MATVVASFEVEDGERWARAWKKGTPGNRHGQFAQLLTARTFRDPENPNSVGVIIETADAEEWRASLASDEAKKAMAEDGLKLDTMRVLFEFTP